MGFSPSEIRDHFASLLKTLPDKSLSVEDCIDGIKNAIITRSRSKSISPNHNQPTEKHDLDVCGSGFGLEPRARAAFQNVLTGDTRCSVIVENYTVKSLLKLYGLGPVYVEEFRQRLEQFGWILKWE